MAEVRIEALTELVRRRIGDATEVRELRRLSGGANQETWSFDAETDGRSLPLILRRTPGGARNLAAGANAKLRITATVLGGGSHANQAQVTAADQQDFDSTPNNGLGQGEEYADVVPVHRCPVARPMHDRIDRSRL